MGQGLDLISGSYDDIEEAVKKSPIKIRSISINNAPPVLPVDGSNLEWLEICQALQEDDKFQQQVSQAMASRFKEKLFEDKTVEERIYGGFYSKNDQFLIQQFQIEDWPVRAELILQFEDPRLKQLGRRLISFYAPGALAKSSKERLTEFLRDKWFADDDRQVPWTTFFEVKRQLAEIGDKPDLAQETKDALVSYYDEKLRSLD
jgi:exodeoxyribonuclease-1